MTADPRWTWLRTGRGPLPEVPGSTPARLDLRNFTVPEVRPPRWKGWLPAEPPRIHRRRIERVDFSGSRLQHLLSQNCTFIDCRFEGADLRELAAFGGSFVRCEFQDCDLRQCLAEWVRMEHCRWRRCDLGGGNWAATKLRHCHFEHCGFENFCFGGSRLEDCTFEGVVNQAAFHGDWGEHTGGVLLRPDFSRAELPHVRFRKLPIREPRWPAGDAHVALSARELDRTLFLLEAREDGAAEVLRAYLDVIRRELFDATQSVVLHQPSLCRLTGLPWDELRALLGPPPAH